jgi:tRNA pseudouridine65 synthase
MKFPLHPESRILAEHSSGILAIEKPAGILTHPNRPGIDSNSMLLAEYDQKTETYSWEGGRLILNNRLDSPTSGIVIACLEPKTAKALNQLFRDKRVHKDYLALVKGIPPTKRGDWRDRLERSQKDGQLRVSQGRGGFPSRTTYERLQTTNSPYPLALLKLSPETGRTHQLRVQAALHRHPIAGDRTYGDFQFNREFQKATNAKRLFLHAHRIEFPVPGGGGNFSVESPVPGEFSSLL